MSHLSKTLRRLGVATVGACTLLAMPYLGGGAAFAVAPTITTAPAITIVSQANAYASIKFDGTNSSVKISANVLVPFNAGTDTTWQPVAGVRFSYQTGAGATIGAAVPIATVATAPYSVEWTPPAAGQYTEVAETLNAAGAVMTTTSKTVNIDAIAPSVHITSPTGGASIGINPTNSSVANSIIVSGTRSADLPTISLSTGIRDNSSGTITPGGAGAQVQAGTVTTPANPNTWSALVPVPACPAGSGSCDIFITALAGVSTAPPGWSDEVSRAPLYTQTFGNIAITPATVTKSTNSPQLYNALLTDQNGQPSAGQSLYMA